MKICNDLGHLTSDGKKELEQIISETRRLLSDARTPAQANMIGSVLKNVVGKLVFEKITGSSLIE